MSIEDHVEALEKRIYAISDRLAALEARAAIPAPFRAEEFGISQEAPICPDPTGEGSAYQPDPAPGSDQDHPPLGYKREPIGGTMRKGYLFWNGTGKWQEGGVLHGNTVTDTEFPIANPIPPAEIDRDDRDARIADLTDRLRRETERAESATGRAVLAERRAADLIAGLGKMIAGVRR